MKIFHSSIVIKFLSQFPIHIGFNINIINIGNISIFLCFIVLIFNGIIIITKRSKIDIAPKYINIKVNDKYDIPINKIYKDIVIITINNNII